MTGGQQNIVASAIFAVIGLMVGADIASDAGTGAGVSHLASEALVTAMALAGYLWSFKHWLAERSEAKRWRAEAERLLAGVGHTVEEQFKSWSLTNAESEVALLLLKGLSFKEIAAVRDTGERTGREQARKVYAKAGVAGRAELSAWFIEDLL